jgi:H2-forming N5,N10-methylenetetrahydromethanopterin dehydrogenase-like enzyme
LYDDSENKVITDQANDALKNAGVEVDMENHNAFEKAELEKTFTQAIKEKAAEKIIDKQNWEAESSKKSSKSSKSSSHSSSAHSSVHH